MKICETEVKLVGRAPLQFDRYIDQSTEPRPPEQKLYLGAGNALVFPAANVKSFLSGIKVQGCAVRFEGKKGKQYAKAVEANIMIEPQAIPVTAKGKPVVFREFGAGKFWVNNSVPRDPSKGIKIPNSGRPVLDLPWELEFKVTLLPNDMITGVKLHNWFVSGGLAIGIGNGRPSFGRFTVEGWEEKEREI